MNVKIGIGAVLAILFGLLVPAAAQAEDTCLDCHNKENPGLVAQWRASKHASQDVGCLECHQADAKDVDAFEHHGKTIAIIVSPKDCANCHEKEFEEQKGSHHARAGEILGSLDNLLGEVVGGPAAVNAGCRQCHGSEVKIGENGQPTPETWPNTGMGRINPDGSKGSCSACHTRHEFSKAQARQPEACGKCHLGPDHPQIEVWNESKHGILYHANREKLGMESDTWRAGIEYSTGPTCASCHMSAAGDQPVTHDVGERISWTLRPPISTKLNMVIFDDNMKNDLNGDKPEMPAVGSEMVAKDGQKRKVKGTLTWEQRRGKMQDVCQQCHQDGFVEGAYKQFDDVVELYNDKFAKPCKAIIEELIAMKKISKVSFDDHIEWIWWEIWHHEGRRARHGAAMQGPDYTWWHGLYDVAKHFYEKFVPELERVAGKKLAKKLLNKHVYSQPGHEWHRDGLSKDQIDKIRNFYEKRYQQ
ncbi:MAG: multiheme c-type cytochrome [Deltaproteobacteria bacterium]|nr:multiheme c-type cytochrome [Deltaproteobacteria bacterium]